MPENIVPVSISYRANLTRIVISGKSSIKQAETTHSNDENILRWDDKGWPVRTVRIPRDMGSEFCQDIRNQQGKMVCDGSYKIKKDDRHQLSYR